MLKKVLHYFLFSLLIFVLLIFFLCFLVRTPIIIIPLQMIGIEEATLDSIMIWSGWFLVVLLVGFAVIRFIDDVFLAGKYFGKK